MLLLPCKCCWVKLFQFYGWHHFFYSSDWWWRHDGYCYSSRFGWNVSNCWFSHSIGLLLLWFICTSFHFWYKIRTILLSSFGVTGIFTHKCYVVFIKFFNSNACFSGHWCQIPKRRFYQIFFHLSQFLVKPGTKEALHTTQNLYLFYINCKPFTNVCTADSTP